VGIRQQEAMGEDLGTPHQKRQAAAEASASQGQLSEEEVMPGHGKDCKCPFCKKKKAGTKTTSTKKGGKK